MVNARGLPGHTHVSVVGKVDGAERCTGQQQE
jgi:hypothetical protein